MTVYYVRDDGPDGDGLSEATAWKNISTVEAFTFATSDKVLFKNDDTWTFTGTDNLRIKLKGISGAKAVLGAYYLDGGVETQGVSGNKPIFNGPYDGPNPGEPATGLIWNHTSGDCDYLTVENFKVTNSDFRGVSFQRSVFVLLDSIDIDTCYTMCLALKGDDGIIRDCTVVEGGRDTPDEGRNPALINIRESLRGLIEGCTISNSYGGEAISIFSTSASSPVQDCIVQDNVVYAVKSAVFYYNNRAQRTIWRRNIAIGAPVGSSYRGADRRLFGMADEPSFAAPINEDVEFSNNLGAAGSEGIWISAPSSRSLFDGHKIVFNTLVDCEVYFKGFSAWATSAGGSLIQNNNFQDYGIGGTMYSGPSTMPAGVDWDNNNYSSGSPGSPVAGANDTAVDSLLKKQAGWNAIATLAAIDFEDFRPDGASPVEDQGVAIAGVTIDYESNATGTPPNIGSFETLGSEDPQPPPPPQGSGGVVLVLS